MISISISISSIRKKKKKNFSIFEFKNFFSKLPFDMELILEAFHRKEERRCFQILSTNCYYSFGVFFRFNFEKNEHKYLEKNILHIITI